MKLCIPGEDSRLLTVIQERSFELETLRIRKNFIVSPGKSIKYLSRQERIELIRNIVKAYDVLENQALSDDRLYILARWLQATLTDAYVGGENNGQFPNTTRLLLSAGIDVGYALKIIADGIQSRAGRVAVAGDDRELILLGVRIV